MKEKMTESTRAKMVLAGIIAELLILAADYYGFVVSPDLLNTVSWGIVGLISSFVIGRSIRNTPTSEPKGERDVFEADIQPADRGER